MKQIFNGIKDILSEFFNENSDYNYVDNKQFNIDVDTQFIYGFNFPTQTQSQAVFNPQHNATTTQQADFTRIFFVPKSTMFQVQYKTEAEVEGEEHQYLVQNFNEYIATFDLIFYSKSPNNMETTEAYEFKELFFNVFRGNVPFLDFLHAQGVWDFSWVNLSVADLSFVEGVQGSVRHQATFSARYKQQTNSYLLDKLQNIQIDEVKTV